MVGGGCRRAIRRGLWQSLVRGGLRGGKRLGRGGPRTMRDDARRAAWATQAAQPGDRNPRRDGLAINVMNDALVNVADRGIVVKAIAEPAASGVAGAPPLGHGSDKVARRLGDPLLTPPINPLQKARS
jgi:hypothetical protein